jgi:microcystin-dependent protein
MLFQQTSAPSGWTKVTTGVDNRALRIVTGNVGSGGATNFTSALNSTVTTSGGIVQNHTLTVAQMPAHQHDTSVTNSALFPATGQITIGYGGPGGYPATIFTMSDTGGGQAHNHGLTHPSFNLNVAYTDVIIAQKN